MRINNVYKYSTLIVCIKITSPFLTLFDLPLLLPRVSDNSVNTFIRQKYWNFELDLKDIYIFFPFAQNGSVTFGICLPFPPIRKKSKGQTVATW